MNIRKTLPVKVREVTSANLNNFMTRLDKTAKSPSPVVSPDVSKKNVSKVTKSDYHMVVIGSSTGGPTALQNIFSAVQKELPVAFAVAQHMPPGSTRALADRLNRFSALTIREAETGDIVIPGQALIAPGGKNLEFFMQDDKIIASVSEPHGRQRYLPSIDKLFASSAALFGDRVLGVVLTGMGKDGVIGTREIKSAGGSVFAEAEESCVVFGMPKEAIATGMVDRIIALPQFCKEIQRYCGY